MAATHCAWCSVSVTSLGREVERRRRGGDARACGDPAARRQRPQLRRLEGTTPTSSAVARARSASQASRARCCGARRALGADNSRRPGSLTHHHSTVCSAGLTRAQADRQCRGKHFAERVVIVLGCPAQQVEGDRIEDRPLVQNLERGLELSGRRRPTRQRRQPRCRSAAAGRRARAPARRAAAPARPCQCARRQIVEDAAQRAYRARSAESSILLSTKPVDKSVEKPGSSTLSARSVSGPIQIGEKVP